MGRHYLETGSSKNPTPCLADHSDFSLVGAGTVLGTDRGRKSPVKEPGLLPPQERLAWEPVSHRVYPSAESLGWKAPSQAPSPVLLKTGSLGTRFAG